MAPAGWEDEEDEDGGSGAWTPSLFVFFMLRSKVPFSSTSMSDSWKDPTQTLAPVGARAPTWGTGTGTGGDDLGAGFPGQAAERLRSLPAAGGQVEDGGGRHVGGLGVLAVVVAGGGGALGEAPPRRCALAGGGRLGERLGCVEKEDGGERRAGAGGAEGGGGLHLKALGEVSELLGVFGTSVRFPNTCTSKLA